MKVIEFDEEEIAMIRQVIEPHAAADYLSDKAKMNVISILNKLQTAEEA
jgi:hypothetical protein